MTQIPASYTDWLNDSSSLPGRGRSKPKPKKDTVRAADHSQSPVRQKALSSPQKKTGLQGAGQGGPKSPKSPKIRIPWSDLEVKRLKAGVAKYGVGQWREIHTNMGFPNRTPVDLKDKWRNLDSPRKPALVEKRKWILMDEEGFPIGEYWNRYPRDAALKAATKGHTHILLREPRSTLVHVFRGWRHEEEKPEIMKFSSSVEDTVWVGRVEKLGTKLRVME